MKKLLFLLTGLLILVTSCQNDDLIDNTENQTEKLKSVEEISTRIPTIDREPTAAERNMLKRSFPNLNFNNVIVTGNAHSQYNCIAWAMGLTNKWVNPISPLPSFQEQFKNAKSRYKAPSNFIVTTKGANRAAVDGWGTSSSNMTHASKFYGGSLYESKCGSSLRITHGRYELSGSSYGNVLTSFNKSTQSYSDLSDIAQEVAKNDIELSLKEKDAVMNITNKVNSNTRAKFNKLYNEWLEEIASNPETYFSNDTRDYAKLSKFAELKAMGTRILPLVIEKLMDSENFVALVLYDELQTNKKQRITYAGSEPEVLEGEQNRAKRTIQKWLNK